MYHELAVRSLARALGWAYGLSYVVLIPVLGPAAVLMLSASRNVGWEWWTAMWGDL